MNSSKNKENSPSNSTKTSAQALNSIPHQLSLTFRDPRGCARFLSKKQREIAKLEHLLGNVPVSNPLKLESVKQRYISTLKEVDRRTINFSYFYYGGHFIVTVGSLMVPALLSIQYTSTTPINSANFNLLIYWITWVLSLLVTICNGILTLFKVDKKYNTLNIMLQKLKSEGYQFIALAGKYTVDKSHDEPYKNYDKKLIKFSYSIEKVIQKQIDEEFHPIQESTTHSLQDNFTDDGQYIQKHEGHAYSLHKGDEKPEVDNKFILQKKYYDNNPDLESQHSPNSSRTPHNEIIQVETQTQKQNDRIYDKI